MTECGWYVLNAWPHRCNRRLGHKGGHAVREVNRLPPAVIECTDLLGSMRRTLRTLTPLALLLCLAACSGQRAPRPTGMQDSATVDTPLAPAFSIAASVAAIPTAVAETSSHFLDSTRLGDTTWFKRGYTLRVIDSSWVRRPAVKLGLAFGLFHLPPDSLCRGLGYSAVTINAVPASMVADLARAKQCGGKVLLLLRRLKSIEGGQLSVAASAREIASWPDGARPYVADGTILAVMTGDDISQADWGTSVPMATRLARWDSINGLVKAKLPGVAVTIRARPTQLFQDRPIWTNLDAAWTQGNGPYRDFEQGKFWKAQADTATAHGIKLIAGLNLLDGGCGPVNAQATDPARRCPPGVLGSALPGTYGPTAIAVHRYQMSAGEVLTYGTIALSTPGICAFLSWQWSPIWNPGSTTAESQALRAFHTKADQKAAAQTLGLIAAQQPTTSCRR